MGLVNEIIFTSDQQLAISYIVHEPTSVYSLALVAVECGKDELFHKWINNQEFFIREWM